MKGGLVFSERVACGKSAGSRSPHEGCQAVGTDGLRELKGNQASAELLVRTQLCRSSAVSVGPRHPET